jgi:hypothetical protein
VIPVYYLCLTQEPTGTEHVSFGKFYGDTWRVHDVIGTHALKGEVSAPLSKNSSQTSSNQV